MKKQLKLTALTLLATLFAASQFAAAQNPFDPTPNRPTTTNPFEGIDNNPFGGNSNNPFGGGGDNNPQLDVSEPDLRLDSSHANQVVDVRNGGRILMALDSGSDEYWVATKTAGFRRLGKRTLPEQRAVPYTVLKEVNDGHKTFMVPETRQKIVSVNRNLLEFRMKQGGILVFKRVKRLPNGRKLVQETMRVKVIVTPSHKFANPFEGNNGWR